MAFEQHLHAHIIPGALVASTLNPRTPVKLGGTSALLVLPAASNNEDAFGITGAATHLVGEVPVVYFDGNIVKAKAGASVGAGAYVGVGSTNGVVAPVAAASGVVRFALGITQSTAAADEIVSVFVKTQRLSGQA